MEVWIAGTVENGKIHGLMNLLTGLAGYAPVPITSYEINFRDKGAVGTQRDLRLVRLSLPSSCSGTSNEEKGDNAHLSQQHVTGKNGTDDSMAWFAYSYGRPPWGEIPLSKLDATVRIVHRSPCHGPDVPGFWTSLGYLKAYSLWKESVTCDIESGPWTVHILVSRLFKVAETENALQQADSMEIEQPMKHAGFGRGEEVSPGFFLVEAWTEVGAGSHLDAIAALVGVGNILKREGAELRPLVQKSQTFAR